MSLDDAKIAAGRKALEFVQEGMHIGLGTGSTAAHFIHLLIERCKKGLSVSAVATSVASEKLARAGGIRMLPIEETTSLDLTVDGADEIDPQKRLIKGAGGALLREKIIASMSDEMIVIADPTKLVSHLGSRYPLPLEITPFGALATEEQLKRLGFSGTWRKNADGSTYVTDNANWILDISLPDSLEKPEEAHLAMLQVPGVVETGFFFNLAKRIVVGQADGSAVVQT